MSICRGVIFDFDGLLVDTEYLHYLAYQQMVALHGDCLRERFIEFAAIAHTSSDGLRKFLLANYPTLTATPWSILYEQKQELYEKLLREQGPKLLPGVASFLQMLDTLQVPMAVATNSRKTHIEIAIAHIPTLELIPIWVTREEYAHPKPAPDAYQRALSRLGKSAYETIGFEDSLRGLTALISAGISPILICDQNHPQMDDPVISKTPYFPDFIEFAKSELWHKIKTSSFPASQSSLL